MVFYIIWGNIQKQGTNTVIYDIVCQKISSESRHDSSFRHSFIINDISKVIIVMKLYSKALRKCDATDKRGEEKEEDDLRKEFEGSSKSMEAGAILNMV